MDKLDVLVVDDEAYVCLMLERMMQNLNFRVETVNDGYSAIEKADARDFDVVLCDINMPDLDGLTILKRIKRIQPYAVFIMISGYSSLESALKATELGAYDYLVKPFSFDQVRLSIHRGIENKKLLLANRRLLEDVQDMNKCLERKVEERTAELRKAYEQLKELDALKSNFLDLISHEVNSPITLISGYLDLLKRDIDNISKEELCRLLEGANQGTIRLKKIINDVMELITLEAGKPFRNLHKIDLRKVLEQNILRIKDTIRERSLKLIVERPDEPLLVMGDASRLQQAFHNVINNAIKYTPDDKSIFIALKKANRNQAELMIADEGIGVPRHLQDKIFHPFYEALDIKHHSSGETKFMGGGMGLGLPISHKIIAGHGGEISLKSKGYDKGSTFIIRLPLVKKTAKGK